MLIWNLSTIFRKHNMKFYLTSRKVTAVKWPMKHYPVFLWLVFFNKAYFTTEDKYSLVRVEEIPQGKPYKLARKSVEHKETIKKSFKHLRGCLEKWMWVADVTSWFVTKCLKKLLHCRCNLQRNSNVISAVITKFLKLVPKCYKMF